MRWLNRYWTLAWVGFAASAVAGCEEDIPSSNVVPTDEIYADIQVVGDGERTDVGVLLRQGGEAGPDLALVPGDGLKATMGGKKSISFIQDDEGRYHTTLNGSDSGAELVVSFERDEAKSTASTVVLPQAFSLQLAMDVTELARGNNVPVTWDAGNEDDDIAWSVKGSCIKTATDTTDDDGDVKVGTKQIEVSSDGEGESCEVSISLERVMSGTLDPAFGKGGKIVAYQRRTVSYTSLPGVGED